tara:strand:- start:2634 stop:3137 length:504 start_codon:yes stop_codon:yes gene_type:complete
MSNIYRYKFSSQITNELNSFVSINKYCIPQDFKDNWDKWIEKKSDLINLEKDRLKKLGYNGNIINKMYHSARYYLKNKAQQDNTNEIKRKKYVRLSNTIKEYMDIHIERIIDTTKPSDGLELFINMSYIKDMINVEMKEKKINKDDITNKIKKMYKNRYYIKQKKSD